MKFLNLLILAIFFCACATTSNFQKSTETGKIIPVFMAEGKQRTAFKITLEAQDKTYNFLLLANKKDGYINFKLIGNFAAVLASLNLRGTDFEYESAAPFFTPEIKTAFEEILLALFAPSNSNTQKYYFKKGEILPYKLKQKGQINKTFLFENYDGNIPRNITVKTKFNVVKINFELLVND